MSTIGERGTPAESDLDILRRHRRIDLIAAGLIGAVGCAVTLVVFRYMTSVTPFFYQTGGWVAIFALVSLLFLNASSHFRLIAAEARGSILLKQLQLRELELERISLDEKHGSGPAVMPGQS